MGQQWVVDYGRLANTDLFDLTCKFRLEDWDKERTGAKIDVRWEELLWTKCQEVESLQYLDCRGVTMINERDVPGRKLIRFHSQSFALGHVYCGKIRVAVRTPVGWAVSRKLVERVGGAWRTGKVMTRAQHNHLKDDQVFDLLWCRRRRWPVHSPGP